ncbi:GIN domain-containing protein [Gilvimarinus xylanilyticus]|uniref:DUF2807 domain-containing protein n=1 Tax=Gilvimarinus xylanilyticus TaxID=2944139 RepID=A0A9X2HZ24_9GAMM|nr:DUF2807 domain-containing protein [Gilvimarinus xylanilyticus]MCP8899694.1 DUF2807 domain-containing protein [Gilvimarinus xylanilyticus]
MATRLLLTMVLVLTSILSFADSNTRSFSLEDVTKLHLDGDITVNFSQTDRAHAEITLVDGAWEDVEIDQNGDRFKVSGETGFWNFFGDSDVELDITLSLPEVTRLELVGEVEFYADSLDSEKLDIELVGACFAVFKNTLATQSLAVEMTGATKLEAETLTAHTAKLELTGASTLKVLSAGSIPTLDVRLTGASNVYAKPLQTQSVNTEATGASNLELQVSDHLKARLSGASNVYYGGTPKLDIKTSGASSVQTY